jgi:hypothetical protein
MGYMRNMRILWLLFIEKVEGSEYYLKSLEEN